MLNDNDRHTELAACVPVTVEPLKLWGLFASQARAITTASVALRRGDPCDEAIDTVRSLSPAFAWWVPELRAPLVAGGQRYNFPGHGEIVTEPLTRRKAVVAQRGFLAGVVQEWLELADVSLTVDWAEDQPMRIGYHASGLFGALAVDLALTVAGSKGVWLCCHCGGPYSDRLRAPKAGTLHYCSLCKQAGPRAAYRAKRKAAGGAPLGRATPK